MASPLCRGIPGSRRCPKVSTSRNRSPPTPCRPCHPAPIASHSWSPGAPAYTGAPAGRPPCQPPTPTHCMRWRSCTIRLATPPHLPTPLPHSWPCQTICHPGWHRWPQMRGQTPLCFLTLLLGRKKMAAQSGEHTNAADLTEEGSSKQIVLGRSDHSALDLQGKS